MFYKFFILSLFLFFIKNSDARLGMTGGEDYDFKTDNLDSYFINYVDGEENINSLEDVNKNFN